MLVQADMAVDASSYPQASTFTSPEGVDTKPSTPAETPGSTANSTVNPQLELQQQIDPEAFLVDKHRRKHGVS